MKNIYLFIVALLSIGFAKAQDPREYNHGSCIVPFQQNDSIKYYLTWSSAYQNSWEHDIYNSVIYTDENGNLITQVFDNKYIGTGDDEAQEPVNAALNSEQNSILSVWEDGTDADAPNVKGQLHKPDGTIIRAKWLLAGGAGSQHSANTAHLSNQFLVFYADEAPPASIGAVVKAKVINDLTGDETQTINFSPNDEDHWWPVSVSNQSNTKTLVVWGNDGYAVRGTVLYDNTGTIETVQAPQDYLTNTQQYYYQVVWLENISKFLLIARNGANNDITDESQICLIDTDGNIISIKTISGGIIRETKPAVKWSDCTQSYHIFYPIRTNELAHFSVDTDFVIHSSNQTILNSDLEDVQWVSTGTWSTFIKDIQGEDTWNNNSIILFIYNDINSNNIVKIPVHIGEDILCQNLGVFNKNQQQKIVYPNPTTDLLYIYNPKFIKSQIRVQIFNAYGKLVLKENKNNVNNKFSINVRNLPTGIYYLKLQIIANYEEETVIKLIKD